MGPERWPPACQCLCSSCRTHLGTLLAHSNAPLLSSTRQVCEGRQRGALGRRRVLAHVDMAGSGAKELRQGVRQKSFPPECAALAALADFTLVCARAGREAPVICSGACVCARPSRRLRIDPDRSYWFHSKYGHFTLSTGIDPNRR